MALPKCLVTGLVLHPDGKPCFPATVVFTLSQRDRDGDITIMPVPLEVETEADGNIRVELWPNAEGQAGTWYTARIHTGPRGRPRDRYPDFNLVVPVAATANLAEISETVPPARIDDARAAVILARGYAQEAAQAAALAQVEKLVWRGAYDATATYRPRDVVLFDGSSFVARAETRDNAPPSLPDTANDWWELLAMRGADGTSVTIRGSVTAETELPPSAVLGDAYVTDDTGHLWVWQGADWVDVGEFRGLPGADGNDGAPGADGQDGREVELSVGEGSIRWRYAGEAGWTALVALADLKGEPGTDGDDGAPGSDGHDGAPGTDGDDGREVELSVVDGSIRWRYVGAAGWTALVALADLKGDPGADGDDGAPGADGSDGAPGIDGDDGREVELSVGDGSIRWRYAGDADWSALVALADLKGESGAEGTSVSIRGSVPSVSELPGSGALGDAYVVDDTGHLWVWEGAGWVDVGEFRGLPGTDGTDGAPGADGHDGREVELSVGDGSIRWRYAGEADWTALVALADLKGEPGADGDDGAPGADGNEGAPGTDGDDGREVELSVGDGSVRWRYAGEADWTALVALADLKGAPGEDGADGAPGRDGDDGVPGADGGDGREVELSVGNGAIRWRYAGEAGWTALVALADLKGAPGTDGNDGAPGADGDDGREVELSAGDGAIRWRYAGEVGWTALVALADLKGEPGADGDDGAPGADGNEGAPGTDGDDGREVELSVGEGSILWRYAGEANWTALVALADLKGAPGEDGEDGLPGRDGDDGREVELSAGEGSIRWRYAGEVGWTALVALADLKGDPGADGDDGAPGADGNEGAPGTDGDDGREIELSVGEGAIRWRYAGEAAWTALVALAELKGEPGADGNDGARGADGDDGAPGADGDDGREIELLTGGGYIRWRYAGDTGWANLVALADLKGAPGDPASVTAANVAAAGAFMKATDTSDAITQGVNKLLLTVAERALIATISSKADAASVTSALAGKQDSLGFTPENAANKGLAGGYAGLDGAGKILASVLPALAITDIFEVGSQAAMLALTAQVGDITIRTDLSKTFGLAAEPASTLANWKELRTPTDVVQSVAGLTGAITGAALKAALALAYSDISGLGTAAQQSAGAFASAAQGAKADSAVQPAALNAKVDLSNAAAAQNLASGFTASDDGDGTFASGTYTPTPVGGNFKSITANGAFTFAAPTAPGSYNLTVDITNGASAGPIAFTGFAPGYPKGDSYVTANGAKFKLHISKTDAGVTGVLEALQ